MKIRPEQNPEFKTELNETQALNACMFDVERAHYHSKSLAHFNDEWMDKWMDKWISQLLLDAHPISYERARIVVCEALVKNYNESYQFIFDAILETIDPINRIPKASNSEIVTHNDSSIFASITRKNVQVNSRDGQVNSRYICVNLETVQYIPSMNHSKNPDTCGMNEGPSDEITIFSIKGLYEVSILSRSREGRFRFIHQGRANKMVVPMEKGSSIVNFYNNRYKKINLTSGQVWVTFFDDPVSRCYDLHDGLFCIIDESLKRIFISAWDVRNVPLPYLPNHQLDSMESSWETQIAFGPLPYSENSEN